MNEQEVAAIVEAEFDHYRADILEFPGVELRLDGIRQDGDWFYVPVVRTTQGIRAYMYYDHLNAVEERIRARHHVKVLLVPAIAA